MRRLCAMLLAAGALGGCGGLLEKDEAAQDFERATSAADSRIKEDKVKTILGRFESAIADYYKTEKRIPAKLGSLVPKYMAEIPELDLPACGRETDKIQEYPATILRDGQVDGSRLRGSGRWGYVYNDRQVVVFVDCLKPSTEGVPWYQVRGVY